MHSVNSPIQNRKFEAVENDEPPISFRIFDASACRFNSPKVSILPRLTGGSFGFSSSTSYSSVIAGTSYRFFSRGRYALQEAYHLAGVGPQGAILIPAYHCRTMLDPAIRRQGKIILYPLDQRLAPDLPAITRFVENSKIPVVALLLTHYFGFPQAATELLSFCNAKGITLIEDCSHAYFRKKTDNSMGKLGRFVVASPYKFCPSEDGGVLIDNGADVTKNSSPRLGQRGVSDQLRSVVRVIRNGYESRLQLKCTRGNEGLQRSRSDEIRDGIEITQSGNKLSKFYEIDIECKAGLLFSRLVIKMSNADQISERRRANFQRWLCAVRSMPQCKPLFNELPESTVPYMFPLYIENPEKNFYVLKKLGLPIYRWDELAVSDCSVSSDYRLRLLHLPCHQSLECSEIDWMIRLVRNVMEGNYVL